MLEPRHPREATALLAEALLLLEVISIVQVSKAIVALQMVVTLIRRVSMNVFVLRKYVLLMAAPINNTAFS